MATTPEFTMNGATVLPSGLVIAKNALILAYRYVVYCYHFVCPISPDHTTQHYVGYADDLIVRDAEHRAGRGARLTQVAVEREIGMMLVWAIPGSRWTERRLKLRHNTPKLCPICIGQHHSAILKHQDTAQTATQAVEDDLPF